VLIANRGEIAVRIAATLGRMGIAAIAVHSDADADARHVRAADAAVRIGPAPASQSYLDAAALLQAAAATGADAVHPGYGFLAESPDFAAAVADAGLTWIGPPPAAMAAMGDKIAAKRLAREAGVPIVPGVAEPGLDDDALTAAGEQVGVPLLVKAAAGGGGKGMRRVDDLADLPGALAAARREAAAAFGSDALLLERLIEAPRHLEVQVLADAHGGVIHLGERECSLQRRHQKIVEEAPSPAVDAALRDDMGAAAVALAESAGYEGAGTVEFVAPADDPASYAFLEMNARLQVEHPVTEAVTGLDLVAWQVAVAAGERLALDQAAVSMAGHAVEARVCAEDPARGFLPAGGGVIHVADQTAAGCRVDTGVAPGDEVTTAYDPLLAKIVAAGADRAAALARLDAGLADYHLLGVGTNVAFLRALLAGDDVRAGRLDTGLVERVRQGHTGGGEPDAHVLAAAALVRRLAREPAGGVVDPFAIPDGWRLGESAWTPVELAWGDEGRATVAVRGPLEALQVRVDDGAPRDVAARRDGDWLAVTVDGVTRRVLTADADGELWVARAGHTWALRERSPLAAARTVAPDEAGPLVAPLPGTVADVAVAAGEAVEAGQTLMVVEAMKMRHPVTAPRAGRVAAVHAAVGEQVAIQQPLIELAGHATA
jgi:acetyl-CoA/propionyl-CoA carboxylase biotin carboxyl carrier protein